MRPINNFVFIDEIENNLDGNPELHYFCLVVIERELNLIENLVKKTISHLGDKGFHAKRDYKNRNNYCLMREMTEIIINNKIFCFSFSFKKCDLYDGRLNCLKEYKTVNFDVDFSNYWSPELVKKITSEKKWELDINNYRQVSSLFLIHSLNTYLEMKGFMKKYRVIFDVDTIKKNEIIIPKDDKILYNIDTVYASSTSKAPVLCLSDHIAYIFGKCMRVKYNIDKAIQKHERPSEILLIKECISNVSDFMNRGQYLFKNVWHWIDYTNKKTIDSRT